MSGHIVIGYDGPDEAGYAIDAAATILRATDAVGADVWRPVVVAASSDRAPPRGRLGHGAGLAPPRRRNEDQAPRQ
jgi:hypothetical protein